MITDSPSQHLLEIGLLQTSENTVLPNLRSLNFSIIIPVYNSAETIEALVEKLIELYAEYDIEIILINDGSIDLSHLAILKLHESYPTKITAINLSKNFGEHQAVMAGFNHASKDYAVVIDDDFQNPPQEILKLVTEAFEKKLDVVYGVYKEKKHCFYRNLGSKFNGAVANFLINKPKNLYLSSFKCLSKFTYSNITSYQGPFPYIDGLIFRVTNNVSSIYVEHHQRAQGKSNYTLKKLITLWTNMVFNFSILPLRLAFMLGFLMTFSGLIMTVSFLVEKIMHPEMHMRMASVIVSLLCFGGVQLIILGLIGEYIGRMFMASNSTPQFIVKNSFSVKQ